MDYICHELHTVMLRHSIYDVNFVDQYKALSNLLLFYYLLLIFSCHDQ